MTDAELLHWNQLGLIPGPGESEEDFLQRIEESKKFSEPEIPSAQWDWARAQLQQIFDCTPGYVHAFYSNRSLPPWQGAVTWIQKGNVSIQLRKKLRKSCYWGYGRDEILAHESVHAVRSAFDEPMFEEFFAFMVSGKRWRKIFGPIVQRPWEIWPLLLSLFVGIFFLTLYLVSFGWIALGCCRLMRLHRVIRRAGNHLLKIMSPKKARAILFRLTDREILYFSQGGEFSSYAERQSCLRWRLIRYLERNGNG